ncbi:MAG: sensor histidine kinase, partial [Chitinophagaceae bacterium]
MSTWTLFRVISIKNILSQTTDALYSISPFFFIKVVFDIARYYSKWYKSEKKASEEEIGRARVEGEKLELQVENLHLERDFLKAQLNPHFLFNTLNNLYGVTIRKDPEAPKMVRQLSEMMRYTLYESNEQMVPLEQELNFLKNYFTLEKLRY